MLIKLMGLALLFGLCGFAESAENSLLSEGGDTTGGRGCQKTDQRPPYMKERHLGMELIEKQFVSISALSAALVLLPSPITFRHFSTLQEQFLATVRRARLNLLSPAPALILTHLLTVLPQRYQCSLSKVIETYLSLCAIFYVRLFAIKMVASIDGALATWDQISMEERGTLTAYVKALAKLAGRVMLHSFLFMVAYADYPSNKNFASRVCVSALDYASLLGELAAARDDNGRLPAVMFVRAFLLWYLNSF